MNRIHYTKPSITSLEIEYATDATTHGWGTRCYEYIEKFEHQFCRHLDVKHAIATSSCTGAIHLGLAALGIGPGDEVILADSNWIATVAPVTHLGATPVFVDILPTTWCIDPSRVEEAITPKTKAIIAVHLYGNLCEMEALLDIGHRYDLPVIEDSAEAIGSVYHGRRAGSMGSFGTFSFHGTKTITTGEGGIFVTNDDALYERVLTLSNHGRSRSQTKMFWPDVVGYKYKMSNVQAAIGCAQIERVEDLIHRKREILASYRQRLGGRTGVHLNFEPNDVVIGAWMPTVVFEKGCGIDKDCLEAAFSNADIDARPFFHPLSSLPMFQSCPENAHAWDIPNRAMNLPSYHDMTEEELDRVCQVLEQVQIEPSHA